MCHSFACYYCGRDGSKRTFLLSVFMPNGCCLFTIATVSVFPPKEGEKLSKWLSGMQKKLPGINKIAGKSIAGRRVYQLPEMYYDLSETEYSLFAQN